MRTLTFLIVLIAVCSFPAGGRERPAGQGPPAEHDLAVTSIDTPAGPHVPPALPFAPAISVRNAGIYPEAGYRLFVAISDSTGSIVHHDSLIVADTLFPDSVRPFAFPDSFMPLASMDYLVTAAAVLSGDGYPDDDTLRLAFSTFQYHDLSVASIDTPAAFVVAPGVPFTPAATVRNGGTFPEGGFFAHYAISDSLPAVVYHDSTAVAALGVSADTQLGFLPFVPGPLMTYRAAVFTSLAMDSFPGNDTLTLNFRSFEYAGSIGGLVKDANAGSAPLPGAVVTAVSLTGSFFDTTDLSGNYLFPSLPNGAYDLSAGKPGYVDSTVSAIAVTSGASISQDFSLGYSSLALLPADSISVMLSPGSADSSRWLLVENTGTRSAACEITWPARASKATGDSAWGLDIEAATSDNLCLGAEFAGANLWVTGAAGSPSSDPNYLYKLDRNGNLLASFPQPSGNGWGWRDLCWDGQFLYGASASVIMQVDTASGDTTGIRTPSPCAVARGLAYDQASDHFFVADFSDSLYEITRGGAVVNAWGNTKNVFGLAWDATANDGPWLWTLSDSLDPGTMSSSVHAGQFDPRAGVYTGLRFRLNTADPANAAAGGLAFSTSFIHGRGSLIALIQDDRDRLTAYDIRPENARWLSLSGTSLSLAPAQRDSVRLTFGNSGLDSMADYSAYLKVSSSAPGRVDSILAIMRSPYGVTSGQLPATNDHFTILPCRPNPARERTVITFSLPRTGRAELAIYNMAGQRVRTLITGTLHAGWHTAAWDGRDDRGRLVSSGIYFSRLRIEGQQRISKIAVLR